MTADEIASEVFDGERSRGWVLRNVPGKLDLGHNTKRWYADEVWAWVASRRSA